VPVALEGNENIEHKSGKNQNRKRVRLVKSARKTGFVGLIVCLKNAQFLYKTLVESGHLTHLPMYRFNQDHIELLFGLIRSKGGFNDNPDAAQFKGAYRHIIVHLGENQVMSNTGNCRQLDTIDILHVSSWRKPLNAINAARSNGLKFEGVEGDALEQDRYLELVSTAIKSNSLSECASSMTAFIAGSVARRLSKTVQCGTCTNSLTQNNPTDPSLIAFRDKFGVTYPSKDVLKICQAAERAFRSCREVSGEKSYRLLQNAILSSFVENPVFEDQADHGTDSGGLNNHRNLLLKLVVTSYLDVKFRKDVQVPTKNSVSIRNFRHRLTIFEGK
jgi:hypothetical protein